MYDGYGLITIPQIIEDAQRALAANAQISATLTCFALVDECATIEWEKTHGKLQSHDRERAFSMWYDMWFKADGCDDSIKSEMERFEKQYQNHRKTENGTLPQIDGQFIYKLRCALTHTLSSNIQFDSIGLADAANRNIKHFTITISEPTEFRMGACVESCDKVKGNSLDLDLQWLVGILLHLVKIYYERNYKTQKFNCIKVYDYTNTYIKTTKNEKMF